MTIPADVPEAVIVKYTPQGPVVKCPYCGGLHGLVYPPPSNHPVTLWKAPACGLYRSGADRLRGYHYTVRPKGAS